MHIPLDSTVASVFHLLDRPLYYVAVVYSKLIEQHKTHLPAHVRIGVTGEGVMPNYRIEHAAVLTGPFRGNNHELMVHANNAQAQTWSTATMSFDEFEQFLMNFQVKQKDEQSN